MGNQQPQQPSVMQFGIRGLAIAMTMVAVLSALVMPWVKEMEVERQQQYALRVAIFALGLLVGLSSKCFFRYRIERRCGYRHLTVTSAGPKKRTWLRMTVAFAMVAGLFVASTFVFYAPSSGVQFSNLHLPFFYGMMSAGMVIWMWWNQGSAQTLEICEQGLIASGLAFRPWSEYKCYRWTTHNKLMLQEKSQVSFATVPPEMRESVDHWLGRYVPCERAAG